MSALDGRRGSLLESRPLQIHFCLRTDGLTAAGAFAPPPPLDNDAAAGRKVLHNGFKPTGRAISNEPLVHSVASLRRSARLVRQLRIRLTGRHWVAGFSLHS